MEATVYRAVRRDPPTLLPAHVLCSALHTPHSVMAKGERRESPRVCELLTRLLSNVVLIVKIIKIDTLKYLYMQVVDKNNTPHSYLAEKIRSNVHSNENVSSSSQ